MSPPPSSVLMIVLLLPTKLRLAGNGREGN